MNPPSIFSPQPPTDPVPSRHGKAMPDLSATPAVSPLVVSSLSLLGGKNTLVIEHRGMQYTLRATRTGKLILTK